MYNTKNFFSYFKNKRGVHKSYIKITLFDVLEKCKSTDAITGESSLGVMPVVAIVTGACVLVVVVISAIIYKIRYVKFIFNLVF